MATNRTDALVIFGATGDLAKLLGLAESFDVSGRGRFYDKTGAIRDVVQNHMLQVLATVLADPPGGQGLGSWRDARSRVVSALRPLTAEDTMEAAWRVVDPVLGDVTPVHPYAKGSWGPKEADRLLAEKDAWHDPTG